MYSEEVNVGGPGGALKHRPRRRDQNWVLPYPYFLPHAKYVVTVPSAVLIFPSGRKYFEQTRNRLLRKVVDTLSLETFKVRLNEALSDLI